MEWSCLQTAILCDKCECITLICCPKGWLLHFRSIEALLLCGNLTENSSKFQGNTQVNTHIAYNPLGPHCQNTWWFISTLSKWRNCVQRNVLIPPNGCNHKGTTSEACHWWNRTSLKCTLMSSPELGSFSGGPYKFQLKPNVKPTKTCTQAWDPIHL